MKKTLYILRGLPGSGKSTIAGRISDGRGVILSTDEYFMDGELYNFNPSRLGAAHKWNLSRAILSMDKGITPVIIDNTNVRLRDAERYIKAAVARGYCVEVREPDTLWKFDAAELARRNRHGVSEEAIGKMLDRWEDERRFMRFA
ncbi:MAG: AAA family ATPase [bacterium]|nr:AAA family ATPase [bacterium]